MALADGLRSGLPADVLLNDIYLGKKDDQDQLDDLGGALAKQWQGRTVVSVVADGALPFAFLRKFRDELFPTATVLYCNMPRPGPELLAECPDCSGIPAVYGVRQTVDMVFTLRPETSMLVAIMDGSSRSLRLRQLVESAMEPYTNRAAVLFPGYEPGDDGGLNMDGLKDVVSSVPKNGALLLLGFASDSDGLVVEELALLKQLTELCDAPVYVLSEDLFGNGVLGGVVISAKALGREAGRMIKASLHGEKMGEMLSKEIDPVRMVDLTVLAQFGIPVELLPEGTVAVHAPDIPEEGRGGTSPGNVWPGVAVLTAALLLFVLRRSAVRKDK
jgi:hypothetical protein